MLQLGHKNLIVWKKSVLLVKEIYHLTGNFPDEEKFGLISQLRRAAVSVSSNISEGAARSSFKERKRFYEIARSSLVEVDTQLELSFVLKFLSKKDLKISSELLNEIFAMLSKMIGK